MTEESGVTEEPGNEESLNAEESGNAEGSGRTESRDEQQDRQGERRDHLTAPEAAVPRRRGDRPLTLRDCLRSFLRRPSPPLLLSAVALMLALRLAQGEWTWRDAVMALGLVAVTPFIEWTIHVYLLHCPPLKVLGLRIELPSAREHRLHHADPSLLEELLLPIYGVLIFLPAIAFVNWALSFPIHLLLGGPRLAYATTGALTAYVILCSYEWVHYLIHTPYRPRSVWYRAIWRNHRLHHYKNERYWFGVTSTIGDRVIGTAPDQREVPRSETARALHAGR